MQPRRGDAATALVENLFRAEHAHLVAALTRILGTANVELAEDVVQDAMISAMHAWRFGPPRDPKAWIARVARNRAVDIIRHERRGRELLPELATVTAAIDPIHAALAPSADAANQLAMMFAVCDRALSPETHVTLILRWLCGFSPGEIGQAFLVDTATIDRRLHRGRTRLGELGRLVDVETCPTSRSAAARCSRRSICCSARATTAAIPRSPSARSCAATPCGWPS